MPMVCKEALKGGDFWPVELMKAEAEQPSPPKGKKSKGVIVDVD